MWGAIAGDIIGSVYEFRQPRLKCEDFMLFVDRSDFTDDTVMTVAVAQAILQEVSYDIPMKALGRKYPDRGYGGMFKGWLWQSETRPYNSFGNGSAMRVSPVGWAFETMEDTLKQAEASAIVSHNHPEGIKGAQSTALAIFLASKGSSKEHIRSEIEARFGYNLHQTLAEIRPTYTFNETCQGSVPQALVAFLESVSYEDAVRKAVSLGGDADTQACIAGSVAEAFYGRIPDHIMQAARRVLPVELADIADKFQAQFGWG
jgi:ADP-ribosylglycohydrolase